MKLTKQLREAFVNAVMADVPQVDYDEQAVKLAVEAGRTTLPKALLEALEKDPSVIDLIRQQYVNLPNSLTYTYLNVAPQFSLEADCPEVWAKLEELSRLKRAQSAARDRLKSQIAGAAASVSTVKALHTLLPEFVKYLPDDAPTTKNLPALANLVSEFVQAGWPKTNAA